MGKFPTLTQVTTTYTLPSGDVAVAGSCNLNGWIDFDDNGVFDPNEFASKTVTGGVVASDLTWTGVSGVTANASIFDRLRFASDALANTNAAGNATDGEVEDFMVPITLATDVSVTKTNTPGVNGEIDQTSDTVTSGSNATYTLTVTNNGPDIATGALVTDVIGTGLTCPTTNTVTITGDGVPAGSFTVGDLTTGGGIVIDTLANGESAVLTYSCQVN